MTEARPPVMIRIVARYSEASGSSPVIVELS